MRKFSIHPADDAGSLGVDVGGFADPSTMGLHSTRIDRVAEKDMQNQKVAYIDLAREARGHTTKVEGAGTLFASASYTANPAHVPVYFLPWESAGAVVRLRIPQAGTRAAHLQDPDLFFTAAINGCSVFVEGPANAPEVYHCGGATATPSPNDGAAFWRSLLQQSSFAPAMGGGEVNKTDYITEQGVTAGPLNHGTTQAALAYENWLNANHSQSLRIQEVRPWGCVMGVRTGGNWTFYLQKNATVSYVVLRKYRLPGMSHKQKEKVGGVKKDRVRTVCRPIAFHEIYPNPVASAFIPNSIPTAHHG